MKRQLRVFGKKLIRTVALANKAGKPATIVDLSKAIGFAEDVQGFAKWLAGVVASADMPENKSHGNPVHLRCKGILEQLRAKYGATYSFDAGSVKVSIEDEMENDGIDINDDSLFAVA